MYSLSTPHPLVYIYLCVVQFHHYYVQWYETLPAGKSKQIYFDDDGNSTATLWSEVVVVVVAAAAALSVAAAAELELAATALSRGLFAHR